MRRYERGFCAAFANSNNAGGGARLTISLLVRVAVMVCGTGIMMGDAHTKLCFFAIFLPSCVSSGLLVFLFKSIGISFLPTLHSHLLMQKNGKCSLFPC